MRYLFIVLAFTSCLFSQPLKASGPNDVVPIPDPSFKTFLLAYTYEDGDYVRHLDRNKDGEIQESEALLLKRLVALGSTSALSAIQSFKGIEYFKNLSVIEIPNCLQLEDIDLTKNESLTVLYVGGKFTSIDLRNNLQLRTLELNNAKLETIVLNETNAIRSVSLTSDVIESFNYPELKNITTLNFYFMDALKDVDFKLYPELRKLSLVSKSFQSLNLDDLKKLNSLFLEDLTIDRKVFPLSHFPFLNDFGLRNISTIERIDLKDNKSSHFNYVTLESLPNLKTVCVDDENEKYDFIKALEPKKQWENLTYVVGKSCTENLATSDSHSKNALIISPNPVKTSFVVKNTNVSYLELMNYSGQIIKTWKAQPNYSVAGIPKGNYILMIHTPDSKQAVKLLIN